MKRAVFLDRDSTINEPVYILSEKVIDSPFKPEEFKLLPRAADGIKILNNLGFFISIATNQPAVAKGKITVEELDEIHKKMDEDLAKTGARIDAIYYCPHSTKGIIPELTIECNCRKPRTELLTRAATEHNLDLKNSYMVGDSWRDIEAGKTAGCTTLLVQHPMQETHGDLIVQKEMNPDHISKDLYGAALIIKKLENSSFVVRNSLFETKDEKRITKKEDK